MESTQVAFEQARPSSPGTISGTDDQASQADQEFRNKKTQKILEACKWADIDQLKSLGETKGGFLTDELRRNAWPILLGIAVADTELPGGKTSKDALPDWRQLPRHKDEDQVQLDVNRAFIYYPNNQSDSELEQHKRELSDLIVEVLRRHPFLCYFQGYHDICQVFLLVIERAYRARVVARLSLLRIRDFMLPSFAPTIAQLRLIPDILTAADPKLRLHLAGTEPYYALAGTLTMYAHNIETYGDIARLFDVLLVQEPVFSIYMFAQIVLSRHDELYETPADDPAMLHFILSKVPKKLDLEALIADTIRLFNQYPPESLRAWRRISSASSLKTARCLEACAKQSLDMGEEHFKEQDRELKCTEGRQKLMKALWLYRRPAGAIGVAIVVGLAAVYLRRHTGAISALASFIKR